MNKFRALDATIYGVGVQSEWSDGKRGGGGGAESEWMETSAV